MSLQPKTYEEAKARYKPMSRKKPLRSQPTEKKRSELKPGKRMKRATISPEDTAWREAVLERDGRQCRWIDPRTKQQPESRKGGKIRIASVVQTEATLTKSEPVRRPAPLATKQYSTLKRSKWNRNNSGRFAPKPGARLERNCVVCGTPFTTWANRVSPAKTCSRVCMGKMMQNRETRVCKHCGNEYEFRLGNKTPNAGQYCSRSCVNKAKRKRYDARGVPARYKQEAHLVADKEWREAVRKKDNYTCQKCGRKDPHIHAHHVAPRSRRPDLLRVIENGKCLDASCHAWVHQHPKEAEKLGLLSFDSYELAQKENRLGVFVR